MRMCQNSSIYIYIYLITTLSYSKILNVIELIKINVSRLILYHNNWLNLYTLEYVKYTNYSKRFKNITTLIRYFRILGIVWMVYISIWIYVILYNFTVLFFFIKIWNITCVCNVSSGRGVDLGLELLLLVTVLFFSYFILYNIYVYGYIMDIYIYALVLASLIIYIHIRCMYIYSVYIYVHFMEAILVDWWQTLELDFLVYHFWMYITLK